MSIAALDEHSPDYIKTKIADAPARLAKGLNERWPFRAKLLHDLAVVTIPTSANATIDILMANAKKRLATRAALAAIASRDHTVRVKPSGLIVTSLISCPRELKPQLLIAGEPVALCDISSAHWMFLPRILWNRIEFCRNRGDSEHELEAMKSELSRLIALCSFGSFYATMCREGASTEEIKNKKKLVNVLLNSPQPRNPIWRGLHRVFPLCFRIIDTIKKDDHRNVSKQLQHFTANAVSAALLDMQSQGLPAIPDTDCLIVREQDRQAACIAVGKAMYAETRGVYVTVGGVRYSAAETYHEQNPFR